MSIPGPEVSCAQNIALLYYLGNIASAPCKNRLGPRDAQPETGEARILSLEDERHLTTSLAFISSIQDDSNKITAVCVEERLSGLVVMVAANAKTPGITSPYLPSVKQGFDGIFSSLKDAGQISREHLGARVLRVIVSMCRSRILSRTRMIKPEHKPPIENSLRTANDAMIRLPTNARRTRFIQVSHELISKMERYRGTFTIANIEVWQQAPDDELEAIVGLFYELRVIPRIGHMLLKDISSLRPRIDPSSCQSLLNTIRKVANYKLLAIKLVKLARRNPFICQATTLIITLDQSSLSRHAPPQRPSLKQTVKTLKNSYGATWNVDKVAEKLYRQFGSESYDYQCRINPQMKDPKIHAEIQLVWQILYPPDPREDLSRLAATHDWPGDMNKRFSIELGRRAVERINEVISNGVTRIEYPLESTVSSAAVSGMTVATLQAAAMRESEHPQQMDELSEASDSDETVVPGSCASQRISVIDPIEQTQDGSLHRTAHTVPEWTGPPSSPGGDSPLLLDKSSPSSSANDPQDASSDVQLNNEVTELDKIQGLPAPGQTWRQSNADTDSQSSDGCPLDQTVSPETYHTRPSSRSTSVSANMKPSNVLASEASDPWKRVPRGSTKFVPLSASLNLYVEYTSSAPSTSQMLKYRARRLSDQDAAEALEKEVYMYDLANLKGVTDVQHSREVYMRVDKEVFVVDLDDFGVE
ncbi:hypothetical protein FZEAL_8160 [Fusarium zealandicum]|uniref:Uncharacterized protein n=1 Tax=Fusarium zealandicum TaxID=1053134 RepID=A0A8H4UF66_9HYPO|nr:hypothetical protein FZEAL_8160 [Fusarium zealandicum]